MTTWTSVEEAFIQRSGKKEAYPNERLPVIEVLNVYELGKIVALTFLEWVQENPKGVIALPTGKTPEYFIKSLEHYKNNWSNPNIQEEVQSYGYKHADYPTTKDLTFVMLDEFFPMLSSHRNSFCNYIQHFYVNLLEIKQENVLNFDLVQNKVITLEEMMLFKGLDVDLSLLSRQPSNEDETKKKEVLHKLQRYCVEYEEKVKALGGIGFFLGGIGPDGHVAFNQPGSAHDSPTRLVNFNYPTAAAAASDLGGIEKARGKAALTLGLGSLFHCPSARVVIMAAGEGKASVIREAVEEPPHLSRPASALHGKEGSRVYITHGAAGKLSARKTENLLGLSEDTCLSFVLSHLSEDLVPLSSYLSLPPAEYLSLEASLYDLSLSVKRPLHSLTIADAQGGAVSLPAWLLSNSLTFKVVCACAERRLKEKVEGGCRESAPKGAHILHTAPHHDDIMLSYHGAMHYMLGSRLFTPPALRASLSPPALPADPAAPAAPPAQPTFSSLLEEERGERGAKGKSGAYSSYKENRLGERYNDNLNHFAYLTSGFHSVSEDFIACKVEACLSAAEGEGGSLLEEIVKKGLLTMDYDDLMSDFYTAFYSQNAFQQEYIENIIFLRKVCEVYSISLPAPYPTLIKELNAALLSLQNDFLSCHIAGDALPKDIQLLKGCMRESEVDRVWACSRMPMNRIHHLRSKFYTDDFFTPMPSLEDDALPVANLLKARQPDILTVAFDPEGTGPDTHYKVLQVVAAGLRISLSRGDLDHAEGLLVWGYRNVWFTFRPSEATLLIPVSLTDLDLMHEVFMACFTTQKKASFPSPYYDGPFSAWSRKVQRDQREMLGVLLGEEYFTSHSNSRIRDAGGFVFIRAMPALQFLREVEELKSKFEITP